MYFAAGSARCVVLEDIESSIVGQLPKELYSTEDGAIISVKETIDGSFFAALSIRAVYLWSTCPAVVISKIYRNKGDIDNFGENVDIFWKPDSTVLAVITSRKYVLFYRILALPTKIFQFEFAKPHHYNLGVAEGIGLFQTSMMFTSAVHLDHQAQSATFWDNLIFLSTRNMSAIVSIDSSNLEILRKETTILKEISNLGDLDESVFVMKMITLEENECHIWLLSNGQLYLAKRGRPRGWGDYSKESTSPISFSWECLRLDYHIKIVSIALNPRFSILATGLLNGDHALFSLDLESINEWVKMDSLSEGRILSWATLISEILHLNSRVGKGDISCMSWSYDGQALAIGFNSDGYSLYSTFGTLLLLATRHSVQSAMVEQKHYLDEQYLNGVSYMFWGPSSYSLCILSSKARFSAASSIIFCIPFMRSIAAANQIPDNFAHSVLLGSETMLILSESPIENNQRPMRHKYIHLPNLYMSENWPSDIAAVSPLGRYVAIAGIKGFALYSRNSATWKMFGNQLQECSFVCKGLLFLNDWLAVLAELGTNEYKIWVFDSEKNLDLGATLSSISVNERPYLMTKIFGCIYLLLESGSIIRLQLRYIEGSSLNFSVDETWKLPATIPLSKITCLSRTSVSTSSFIFLCGGDIYLFDNETSLLQIVDSQVECVFSTELLHPKLSGCVWLSSRGECHIASITGEKITFPLDFTPLSLSAKKGYLVGLAPQLVVKKGFELLTYTLNSKTCLYLHHVLEYFLKHKMTQAAHEFSSDFSHLGYFSHALEMLLHCVWEREAETQPTVGSTALLPEVVAFIKQFEQFLDIIVNCARKTELTLWDYLFSFIDSPQVLFDECLEKNQLNTATSFLVILHNMGPHRLSGKESIRLLEKLLQSENFELSRDLVRFLRSIGGKGASVKLWESLNQTISGSEAPKLTRSESSNFSLSSIDQHGDSVSYFELLVRRHACHLISSFRIRSLLSMSISLDFPLSAWLSKERYRHAKLEAHFDALQQLHIQFDWPYPMTIPGIISPSSSFHNLTRRHSLAAVSTPLTLAPAHPVRDRRAISFIENGFSDLIRIRSDALQDLKTLAKMAFESECLGWAFLLAAMLGDPDRIVNALTNQDAQTEWRSVESALIQTEAPGYQLFATIVHSKLQNDGVTLNSSEI